MAIGLPPIPYAGTFQDTRVYLQSESPLEEVWAYVARIATDENLARVTANNPAVPWPEHLAYAKVRVQQAVEFRAAAHISTLLTAPLTLYYAFLNLMRAQIALVPEQMPHPLHGLKFKAGADLLSSHAELTRRGTFTHYLDAVGIPWQEGAKISLRDAMACIVEMRVDNALLDPAMTYVQPVTVAASSRSPAVLTFHECRNDFAANWATDFPGLVVHCDLTAANALTVKQSSCDYAYNSIGNFLHEHLQNNLTLTQTPIWWMLPRSIPCLILDRISYYHIAAFILGSAVRYEPELVLAISGPNSGAGYLIKRFLQKAERFYPQLQLTYGHSGKQIYF